MSREEQLCLGSLAAILRPRAGFLPCLGNSALNWVKTAEGSMQKCSCQSLCSACSPMLKHLPWHCWALPDSPTEGWCEHGHPAVQCPGAGSSHADPQPLHRLPLVCGSVAHCWLSEGCWRSPALPKELFRTLARVQGESCKTRPRRKQP